MSDESNISADLQFRQIIVAAKDRIESGYGIAVVWRDLPSGVTGDLNGEEIVLDRANDPETELYVLLHLFGHTCQWNTSDSLRVVGYEQPRNASPEKMLEIHDYEQSASRIGLSLLREIGHGELREWLSRFFAADWEFLRTLYTTGEHAPALVRWDRPVELLIPLDVPEFSPKVFLHRQAFD